ncbi:MAG: hypothetical protein ACSHWZ_09375, partial [Sulfitobacter sp.]
MDKYLFCPQARKTAEMSAMLASAFAIFCHYKALFLCAFLPSPQKMHISLKKRLRVWGTNLRTPFTGRAVMHG